MIIIGDLRNDIIVQRKVINRDSFGGENETYFEHLKLKSSIKYNSGNKTTNNDEVFSSRNLTFITYYRDIKEDDRILYNNKLYKINFIEPINFRSGLKIYGEMLNE